MHIKTFFLFLLFVGCSYNTYGMDYGKNREEILEQQKVPEKEALKKQHEQVVVYQWLLKRHIQHPEETRAAQNQKEIKEN